MCGVTPKSPAGRLVPTRKAYPEPGAPTMKGASRPAGRPATLDRPP